MIDSCCTVAPNDITKMLSFKIFWLYFLHRTRTRTRTGILSINLCIFSNIEIFFCTVSGSRSCSRILQSCFPPPRLQVVVVASS